MTLFRSLRNIIGAAALAGAVLITAAPTQAHARVFVSVAIAPPAINLARPGVAQYTGANGRSVGALIDIRGTPWATSIGT